MTGQELLTLTGHDGGVFSAVYSPDGEWIATASGDKTAKVWNHELTQSVLIHHDDSVSSVSYRPDGKRILTASWDKTSKVWDAETTQVIISP